MTVKRIIPAILSVLDQNGGEIHGTRLLAEIVGMDRNGHIHRMIQYLRVLEQDGQITICRACGGRGRRTVYKINPNQPGLSRQTK